MKNKILLGLKGEKNGNWKGGKHSRVDGYKLVRKGVISRNAKGSRYILEHRLIMEKHLGRKLKRSEVVHHKNGNNSDNRISNLEIITQSEHAKLHYKTRKRNKLGQYV